MEKNSEVRVDKNRRSTRRKNPEVRAASLKQALENSGHAAAMIIHVSRVALSSDTSPDIEQMQVEAWRRMTPQQKAAIVKGLTQATFDLAIAGIQHRYPDASPQEQRLRLAIVTLGRDLAQKAFPEIATLDLR